jgi:endo-1,4-beta-xylanase
MGVLSRIITPIMAAAGVLAAPAPQPMAESFSLPSGNSNSSLSDLVRRAQAVNYNQNYIASGAGVTYSPNQGTGTFSVNYNTAADFVVGLGWQPGDSK